MPDPANGVALYITDDGRYGPYLNAPISQRLQFRILDASENFYFGINPRERTGSPLPLLNNLYYKIKRSDTGATVYKEGFFTTTSGSTGFIENYADAVAGPKIGGAATGYVPLEFNPTAVGDYYIEIYKSDDNGVTQTDVGGSVVIPYFDFSVADASDQVIEGRLFSQKWGFITYDPATFVPAIGFDFKGKFFGYTDDQIIVSVDFQEGFRPFGYLLSMNKFGVVDDDNAVSNNWETTRKSISYGAPTSNTIPTLLNGYPVFITEPDTNAFPVGSTVPPVLIGDIFGCPGNYLFPVKLAEAGDVAITLDLNGVAGFQEGTSDIIIEAYNQPQGNIVVFWDGLDGLGNAVRGNTSSSAVITSLRGRTSIPMIDAELNPNGLTITSVAPVLANRRMYWDDSDIVITDENTTVGGQNVSSQAQGLIGPTHKWNGDNPPADNTPNNPAPAGSKGNTTPETTDDYGNERVLNTWFYGEQVASPENTVSVPNCDVDNDGLSDDLDLDDDNDGILDTVELGGFDPDGDADGDTVPDYIDPQFAGFIDSNGDGVDDRFDLDLDGRINSWDLDSDGDGIPDNIEAQTTLDFIVASSTIDTNGVPDNYNGGISVIDTDGDSAADYLDTDADGDSVSDTLEANLTLSGSDSDRDGLDNNIDTTTGLSDPDGNINNPNTLPDNDNDLGIDGGDVDFRDATDSDFDNDGIADFTDVDDDNDGILDVDECNVAPTTTVFTYTGADQSYTIPSNVVSVTAKIWGAGGRGDVRSGRGVGGAGGYSEITILTSDLTSNTLILTVGQGGNSSTGSSTYGNGGAGFFSNSRNYGAGGGMSAISYITLNNPGAVSQADLIAIAGGGGTMPAFTNTNTNAGEGGGDIGGAATDSRTAINGQGGTQAAGGASTNGNPGTFLQGGAAIVDGGAGGGGYYGGGSGSIVSGNEGGGGGGSGYFTSLATSTQTLRGSVQTPPMNSDGDYITGVGVGGNNSGQNGGNGLIVLIINYKCDTDNDGIANNFDTDSDNDGCPDAIEGAGTIQPDQLTALNGGSNGGSSNNLGTTSNAQGNPIVNGSGFSQSTAAAVTDNTDKTACQVDLSLSKTVNKPIFKVGDEVIFTLRITNEGKLTATGIQVKDILPSGLTYNAGNSTIPLGTTYNSTTGIWDLSSLSVATSQTISLQIAAIINNTAVKLNTAEIIASTSEDEDSTPNNAN